MFKIYGVLLLLTLDDQLVASAVSYLKAALKIYNSLGILKGIAVCQLAIIKICHDYYEQEISKLVAINHAFKYRKSDDTRNDEVGLYS